MHIKKCSKRKDGTFKFEVEVNRDEAEYLFNYALNDLVKAGFMHQGVFLPQVATETGWSKEQFLSQLCAQKAGLPPDAWKDPNAHLEIFTADVFSEQDVE